MAKTEDKKPKKLKAEKVEKKTKKAVAKKTAADKKTTAKKTAPKKEAKVEKKTAKKVVADSNKVADDMGKQQIIGEFATRQGDTGSPEVQVAILTWKVKKLQEHLAENAKDNHSRRGLLKIISKRRRIMKYLKDKDETRFNTLENKIKQYQTS
jgi:small subunit ribosomal protein S15